MNINKQLEIARESLLDLTMRNRLVNFKPSKSSTIQITDEVAREVYDILVLQEKAMSFRPTKDKGGQSDSINQNALVLQDNDLSDDEKSILWDFPAEDQLGSQHTDSNLDTKLDREVLQRRLFKINQQARSAVEEQGYTILYLALGFVEWYESVDSIDAKKAPLILIPVELQRINVKSVFKLVWSGEDITTNISLKAILANQGVDLPEFEMPEDKTGIDQYIKNVIDAISNFPKWKVLNDIHLGFFSFTKFVMYKDLDSTVWPDDNKPSDHPLLKTLFGYESDLPSDGLGESDITEENLDSRLTPKDVYHVMDADPSQILVMESAKKGSNLVVEGPPGTGKSQTITNLIAELLAKGKTVLFVSEKMAALEVVKRRLDHVGLGTFCFELHSRKSNKKDVLNDLEKTIFDAPVKFPSASDEYHQLHQLRNELNQYARDLREPLRVEGFSPFDLYLIREKEASYFTQKGVVAPRILGFRECEKTDYTAAKRQLQELGEVLPFVGIPKKNSWWGCSLETIFPSDEDEIIEFTSSLEKALAELKENLEKVSSLFQLKLPANQAELAKTSAAIKIVLESSPTDQTILLNSEWNQPNEQAQRLICKLEEFADVSNRIVHKVKEAALIEPIQEILDEFKAMAQSRWRFLNAKYHKLSNKIKCFYQGAAPKKLQEIIKDLEQLAVYCQLKKALADQDGVGKSLFGSFWLGDKSDCAKLKLFSDWIVTFRRELLSGLLTEKSTDIINQKDKEPGIMAVVSAFELSIKRFDGAYLDLTRKLALDTNLAFGGELASAVKFSALSERCKLWRSDIHKLPKWAAYIQRRNDCLKTIAKPVCTFLEENALVPEDLLPIFNYNFSDGLLKDAFLARQSLARFDGDLHFRKVQRFADLDQQLVVKNRHRLINKLYDERPKISDHSSAGSEAGILIGEFSKKRRHMPIRKLLFSAGPLIQKIKPCFMMSPLSIAQFLDPNSIHFDVIVFDEASQVKPQDALGAFLRGKQVVVMGDTKQLPPTSFFDHMVASDEDDVETTAAVSDVESLLHLCKGRFPSKMLRWHYRSKHESLIAVSNQEFYENRLLIYPSAIDKANHIGLSLVHLPDAIYDRGRSSVNRKEAKAVAEAAVKHYLESPSQSLGIGTFNIKQQEAILEEIELQLRLNPGIESHFSSDKAEHFFVKNLETIQGDERDVIFLSIGYGFDDMGKLSKNFGPLNQEGGQRRLNVLITRAREKCVVFSNFRAMDLSLDEGSPFGLQAFKVFLDYAETRNLRTAITSRADTDSPFEDAVYAFLTDHGYVVRKQVGCASFRVDLAVVDERFPGRYLVGIECDGAKYHNSPVARDRDRLRQQILEGLGWQIHRIWSTDWYRNRQAVEKKLLQVLDQLKKKDFDLGQRSKKDTHEPPTVAVAVKSQSRQQGNKDSEKAPLYDICQSLAISTRGELHEQTPAQLASAVTDVVEVEGPVHFDEVVRRIRNLWGLKRAGARIEDAVRMGVEYATQKGKIKQKKEFLWPSIDRALVVRRREEDPLPKIDLICDEEIGEAIKWVLKQQFATVLDDLVIETSRRFGLQATRADAFDRIKAIVLKLIETGVLVQKTNGMISSAV